MNSLSASITYKIPDEAFWEHYVKLWENSTCQSVFQLPGLLKYFVQKYSSQIAIYQFWKNQELLGAGFFRKEKGVYHFLSDVRSDFNFFTISSKMSEADLHSFFAAFFHEIKVDKWNLKLNKVPSWLAQYGLMRLKAEQNSNFITISDYGVSPIIESSSPESLAALLELSKNVKYKSRRLIRNHNPRFEILRGEEDLQNWVKDFTQMHIQRWEHTDTPSKYHNPMEGKLLLECLRVWAASDVLVRSALVVKDRRIATNFGLLQGTTFVGQGQGYLMEYYKHSPGKVLFSFLADWMMEHGISNLDFGDGNDPYKYEFPVKDRKLESIQIANRLSIPFMLKSYIRKEVKNSPWLRHLVLKQIRPLWHRLSN